MRRFYKDVSVTNGNGIMLDARPLKSPAKHHLVLPTQVLAEAVAAEWSGQGAMIDRLAMPLTRLANITIDRISTEREKIEGEILAYAGSDLVCYRAETPASLVERQSALWNPVVDWALRSLDAQFRITRGIIHIDQPPEALNAISSYLRKKDDFVIAGLHDLTTLTGSALIAAMVEQQAAGPTNAWTAAHADEDWQIEQWGQDEEANLRRARRKREFQACCQFFDLLHQAAGI